MKPHVVPNEGNEADADTHQNPEECGNHGDSYPREKFEPGVVIVFGRALKKVEVPKTISVFFPLNLLLCDRVKLTIL